MYTHIYIHICIYIYTCTYTYTICHQPRCWPPMKALPPGARLCSGSVKTSRCQRCRQRYQRRKRRSVHFFAVVVDLPGPGVSSHILMVVGTCWNMLENGSPVVLVDGVFICFKGRMELGMMDVEWMELNGCLVGMSVGMWKSQGR